VQREDTTLWKTNLMVNDYVVPLNRFTQTYIGNILRAMALSLGYNPKEVSAYIDGDEVRLYTEEGEIPIVREFAKAMVTSTVKGVLSPLKGIFWLQRISINTRLVEESLECWPPCDDW